MARGCKPGSTCLTVLTAAGTNVPELQRNCTLMSALAATPGKLVSRTRTGIATVVFALPGITFPIAGDGAAMKLKSKGNETWTGRLGIMTFGLQVTGSSTPGAVTETAMRNRPLTSFPLYTTDSTVACVCWFHSARLTSPFASLSTSANKNEFV